jgi:hypothetical protein
MGAYKKIYKTTTSQDIINMLEEVEIPLTDLTDVLDVEKRGKHKLLTPEHTERTDRVDLQYPIIVTVLNGEYKHIIDGHHRVLKARQHNLNTIKGKVVDLSGYSSKDKKLIIKIIKLDNTYSKLSTMIFERYGDF